MEGKNILGIIWNNDDVFLYLKRKIINFCWCRWFFERIVLWMVKIILGERFIRWGFFGNFNWIYGLIIKLCLLKIFFVK